MVETYSVLHVLNVLHSTILPEWFKFVTTSVRFHYNNSNRKFSSQTANSVSKQAKQWRKRVVKIC